MPNYRRLISYIYAYEGGVKGKNTGYAKIEVRGEQCRIQASVKKVFVGSNDIGVYLLAPGKEILLGKIFIRGGSGEFRMQVSSGNVEGSGYGIGECYGLTIHDMESAWQCYTTIWEDAVAQAAEVQLEHVTAENVRRQQEKIGKELPEEKQENEPLPISAEIQRQLEQEEARLQDVQPWEVEETETAEPEHAEAKEQPETAEAKELPETAAEQMTETGEPMTGQQPAPESSEEEPSQVQPAQTGSARPDPVTPQSPAPESHSVDPAAPRAVVQPPTTLTPPTTAECLKNIAQNARRPAREEESYIEELQDPELLKSLERQEKEAEKRRNSGSLWSRLQRSYSKVLAFDYDHGCEILSIKPQDIGLLPREIWVYGNNSFLLHGYYNYRHLILARLNTVGGGSRYLLGVPGHYYSNEKYMASMFGFPHFVLAKKQPEEDGRFGYWYTDIRL